MSHELVCPVCCLVGRLALHVCTELREMMFLFSTSLATCLQYHCLCLVGLHSSSNSCLSSFCPPAVPLPSPAWLMWQRLLLLFSCLPASLKMVVESLQFSAMTQDLVFSQKHRIFNLFPFFVFFCKSGKSHNL